MVSTIIRDYDIVGTDINGSLYALLDTTTRTILEEDLGEKFEKGTHLIRAHVSVNSKGKRFVALWFEKKK